ncbi:MAG: hypothetical protein ABGY96_25605 [bacterium]|nr:hypothetical protein [Gammaproteobacteria bacterium]HIL94832.1 hypothetical protein [Pseudomonadales bacterium]
MELVNVNSLRNISYFYIVIATIFIAIGYFLDIFATPALLASAFFLLFGTTANTNYLVCKKLNERIILLEKNQAAS